MLNFSFYFSSKADAWQIAQAALAASQVTNTSTASSAAPTSSNAQPFFTSNPHMPQQLSSQQPWQYPASQFTRFGVLLAHCQN